MLFSRSTWLLNSWTRGSRKLAHYFQKKKKTRTFVNNNCSTYIVHFLLVSSSTKSKLVTFSPIYGTRKLRQNFCLYLGLDHAYEHPVYLNTVQIVVSRLISSVDIGSLFCHVLASFCFPSFFLSFFLSGLHSELGGCCEPKYLVSD
uniref:Uncharacterized protein n=1 Tax=Aegilops tauschii subsp. strangulata TaxID=200361 RepID=A0A453TBQ2_AEGTS